jgi:iron complex transport system substrate-binding protein
MKSITDPEWQAHSAGFVYPVPWRHAQILKKGMPMSRLVQAIVVLLFIFLSACSAPAAAPTVVPPAAPTAVPTAVPPTAAPAEAPTAAPTEAPAEPTAAPTAEAAPATAAGDPSAFPVTIEHKFGSTEITALPTRIVAIGLTEQDALLALGVVPVGTTEWFGEYPGAIWPWAQDKLDALGGATPEVLGDASTINFEKIVELKPDVILALYSGVTQEQYDLLAQIAPTVAQPKDYVDYGIPWQELTQTVGKVVGQEERANELIAEVDAQFAAIRAEHPEFNGATGIVATPYEGIWVYGPEDVRGRFLTSLGFTLPENLAEITGADFGGNLSMERADVLNVDAIIWLDASEAKGPLGGPVYASLPVHTEGREVYLSSYEGPLGGATSFVTVLSLPFLLDGLVPLLADAVDGDPATVVDSPAKP